MLVCPKCHKPLSVQGRSYQCENHHNYDVARQGYVNLILGNQKISGDSMEMVHARTHFLNQGFYQPLRDKLLEVIRKYHIETLADLGCGEGYYTRTLSSNIQQCVGIDMSRDALKYAAVHDKKSQYVLASIFHCPLASHAFDGVTNIFAPLPEEEVLRLMKEEGYFIRVLPAKKHLWELKCELYEEVYENEIDYASGKLQLIEEILVEDVIEMKDNETISALFMMTPYYWKTSKAASDHLKSLTYLTTSIAFSIQIYQKNT